MSSAVMKFIHSQQEFAKEQQQHPFIMVTPGQPSMFNMVPQTQIINGT